MREIYKKYIDASKIYVEIEKVNDDVIGIIISGSMKYSTIDKNSDIDIQVILDPKCDYRERGNLWINGIEIEYFKNPPAQILSYFKKEKKSPHTAHMLAFGEIAYSESKIIDQLVSAAKAIIKEKPQKLANFEIELEKYCIDDYYKDFEDALINKDAIGSQIIRNKIVNRSIDIFCKIHQLRRGKDKKLSKQIMPIDPIFMKQVEMSLIENWNDVSSILDLRIITEKLLGGRRTEEWKLRSKLDL